jgi:VWFA-related protein
VLVTAAALTLGVVAWASPALQQATFRATVDLVAVDVQVVDKEGRPIPNLGPDKFEVLIDGRRRRVVSADFVRQAENTSVVPARPASDDPAAAALPGRVFMIAVDVNSFSVGDSRGVIAAARRFVKALLAEDRVGLFAFPVGPKMGPTADHLGVELQLDKIVGASQSMESSFHLSASEVVDITAENAAISSSPARGAAAASPATVAAESGTLRRVLLRECGGLTDQTCATNIRIDAESMAYFYEGQATMALSGLTSIIRDLSALPGRKTVVLLSAGMTASDRPGGRPNVDDLAQALGRTAAESNASVYALHIDTGAVQAYSADKRRSTRSTSSAERESALNSRLLDMFSGASGGTMLRVLVGSGEGALDRVLRETSSHYLLGVEPADSDRGRLRELKVKVSQPGVTVRSRLWVSVPKKRAL